jgi:hypothetical protein
MAMIAHCIRQLYKRGNNGNQRGQILIIALVAMLFVSLIIAAALELAGSSLRQGAIIEDRTRHLYTADAGIESAWQKISFGDNVSLPASENQTGPSYIIDLEGRRVTASITLLEDNYPESMTYLVSANATPASGKKTGITAKLRAEQGDFFYFLDNAITTEKNCDVKNKVPVEGWIASGSNSGKEPDWIDVESTNTNWDGSGYRDERPTVWPTSQSLTDYYQKMVDDGTATKINGNLTPSGYYELTKTLYVAGDFTMSSGNLNLNGHTLFVDGNVKIHQADVNYNTNSTGCIVATKDVEFWPNHYTSDPANGVFVFCLGSAGAEFQPGGDFYGWIAAQNGVQLKSGSSVGYHWVDPTKSLLPSDPAFPGLQTAGGPGRPAGHVRIITWHVKYN